MTPLVPASDQPTVSPDTAEQYAKDFGVSQAEATRRLELQSEAMHLDSALRETLGSDYAGTHFDNEDGTIVVSAATESAEADARNVIAGQGLAPGEASVHEVSATLGQLQQLQVGVVNRLEVELGQAAPFTVGIDTAANAVRIEVASDAPDPALAQVREEAESPKVTMAEVARGKVSPEPTYCWYRTAARTCAGVC